MMMTVMTAEEIKEWREKLILGMRGAPAEIKDLQERKLYRIYAIYVLGKVLGMPGRNDDVIK